MEVLKGEKEELMQQRREEQNSPEALEQARAELQQARDSVEAIEEELQGVEEERDSLRSRVEEIENLCQEIRMEKMAIEIALKQSVSENRDSGGKLMLIIQEMEDEMQALKDEHRKSLQEKNHSLERLEQEIERVKTENSTLKANLMEHEDEQLANLGTEHELDQLKSEIESLRNTHETDKQRMAKLMLIIQEKEGQVKSSAEEIKRLGDLRRTMEDVQYELNQVNTEKQILRSKLDEAQKTILSDNEQNDERIGEVRSLHRKERFVCDTFCSNLTSVIIPLFTAHGNYRRDEIRSPVLEEGECDTDGEIGGRSFNGCQ